MIEKSLKRLSILKFFQFLLAFLCFSAPIVKTEAFLNFLKNKKKPAESKKSVNKRAKIKSHAKDKNSDKEKKVNKKSKKNAKHPRDKKSVPGHSKKQGNDLSEKNLQRYSDENVTIFGNKIGCKSSFRPQREDILDDSAKAMESFMPALLPASQFYDYPKSNKEIVTVPLKKDPLIESSGKEFTRQVSLFLADHKFDPKLKGYIENLQHANQSIPKEKKVFKEKLSPFMELHKKYHDPKKCRLNFEESKFSILLDHAKKIEALVSVVKQNNPQDDLQSYKNSILTELNAIENILGYKETKEKRETVQVQKVTYERPKGQEGQSKDEQNNDPIVKKNLLHNTDTTAPGAA